MSLLKAKQITGTGPLKFITTDSNNVFVSSFNFTAASIPFVPGGSGMVSTDVNAAIIEAFAGFSSPIGVDLIMGNTFVIKAANGGGQLNLRAGANNVVTLSTDNGALNAGFIELTNDTSIAIGLLGKYIIDARDNTGGSYTTSNNDKVPVAVSTRNIIVNSAVVNTVALGGIGYTVKTNAAAYIQNLAVPNIASGFEVVVQSDLLSSDRLIKFPNHDGTLLVGSGSVGYFPWYQATEGLAASSLQYDGISTNIGIGGTNANVRFYITNSLANGIDALKIDSTQAALAGTSTKTIDFNPTLAGTLAVAHVTWVIATNVGRVNLTGGASNTLTNYYASRFGLTAVAGITTNYYGVYIEAPTGAGTVSNKYALVTESSAGSVGFGTITPAVSALVDITSTTKGFLPPRVTTVQRNAISSPTAGLLVFDTDIAAPFVYSSVWNQVQTQSSSDGIVYSKRISISSVEFLSLFTVPKQLIAAPGLNKSIDVLSMVGIYTFNTTAYAGNTIATRFVGGGTINNFTGGFTTAGANQIERPSPQFGAVLENTAVEIYVAAANPTLGDGTYEIEIFYRIVDTP